MTPELIAIIAVGAGLGAVTVGLGGVLVAMLQLTNRRLDSLEQRVEQRFTAFNQRM